MEPLISVIVPVYKVEKYLDRCVESIVNQTYTNLEIILVDDGSPDNCPQMCDDWASKDSRIKVIHKENGGLSSARNAGLDIMNGEYVCFADSDDYIDADYCRILFDTLIQNSADISICGVEKVFESGKDSEYSVIKNENLDREKFLDRMEGYGGWCWVVAWNKLYKSSIFSQIRYPLNRLFEDDYIIVDVLYSVSLIACTEKNLYYYYQRDNSITNRGFDLKFYDSVDMYLSRLEFFIEKKQKPERMRFCLKYAVNNSIIILNSNVLSKENKELFRKYHERIANAWKSINNKREFGLKYYCYFSLYTVCPKLLCLVKKMRNGE